MLIPSGVVLADSMVHNLPPLNADVECCRGATIWELGARVAKGWIKITSYQAVLLCVVTNNFDPRAWKGHIKPEFYMTCVLLAFTELVNQVKRKNPGAVILVCSVLPRPVDHTVTCGILKDFNRRLEKVAKVYGWGYVATWKAFARERPGNGALEPLMSLYTGKGLHLSAQGAETLKSRLSQALSPGNLVRLRKWRAKRTFATPQLCFK